MKKIRFTLRYKILLFILSLLILILLIITPLYLAKEKEILLSNLIKRGQTLVKNFALSCENLLITSDELGLEDEVDVIVKEKDVLSAYIVLKDLTYFLHNNPAFLGKKYLPPTKIEINLKESYNIILRKKEIIYQFFYPVFKTTLHGKRTHFGTAYIEITTKFIYKHLNKLKIESLLIFFGIFVLGVLGTIFLSSVIVKPIKKLMKCTEIIGGGNLKYRIKLHTGDEIEMLAKEFNKMTLRLYKAQRKLIKQKLVEQELKIAKSIQKDIIPDEIPQITGYEVLTFYKPAREIGGDYYSFIEVEKYKKGIVIADVAGKGIPAALIMSMFHTIINFYGYENINPVNLMKKAAFCLSRYLKKGNFITSIIGILDLHSNIFKFVSAGHEAPIYFSSKKNSFKMIKSSGVPIGLIDEKTFVHELSFNKIKLDKNDLLFLYTDGIRNLKKKNAFTNEELINFYSNILKISENSFSKLKNKLNDEIYSYSKSLFDDITIIGIKRIR